ncbi:hypothetical protein BDZ88DRAFT_504211 [Geranomyces variabilis]|nr:hypothetical protein BDZ88DRAFT_504211 [Geranomyces variabilis]KAJ3139586.1 hypothetical protein HDU90_009087 [Geranomyces variabilis]
MSYPVYLYGVVATADHGYRVFSLRLDSRHLPLSQTRLLVARRLGLDPNSSMTDRLRIFRFDEDVDEKDRRLLRGREDPTTLFRLSLLRESLRDVGEMVPRIGTNALHVLVILPATTEDVEEGLEALPPAYTEMSGDGIPTPAIAQLAQRDTKPQPIYSDASPSSVPEPESPRAPSVTRYPPRAQIVPSRAASEGVHPHDDYNILMQTLNSTPRRADAPPLLTRKAANKATPKDRTRRIIILACMLVTVVGAGIVAVLIKHKSDPTPYISAVTNTNATDVNSPTDLNSTWVAARARYSNKMCSGEVELWEFNTTRMTRSDCFTRYPVGGCTPESDPSRSSRATCTLGTSVTNATHYGSELLIVSNCPNATKDAFGLPITQLLAPSCYPLPTSNLSVRWGNDTQTLVIYNGTACATGGLDVNSTCGTNGLQYNRSPGRGGFPSDWAGDGVAGAVVRGAPSMNSALAVAAHSGWTLAIGVALGAILASLA